MNDNLFTKETLAIKLNVSIPTINRLIKAKKIEYVKVGKSVRFSNDSLKDYLESATMKVQVQANFKTNGGEK